MDTYLFNSIHGLSGRWFFLDWMTLFFAQYSQYFLIALVAGFWFFGKNDEKIKNRAAVCLGFLSAILAKFIIVNSFRALYFRPRPFMALHFQPLFNHASESSFPSGHAATFFALAVGVYFYNKKLGLFLFSAAFFMGIARILGGVHWPSDIAAGAFVGILTAYTVNRVTSAKMTHYIKKLAIFKIL